MNTIHSYIMNDLNYKYEKEKINITYKLIIEILTNHNTNLDINYININDIAEKIFNSCAKEMSLNELYNYIADYCAVKNSHHPDYDKLASRILISRLYETTVEKYSDAVHYMYYNKNILGEHTPLISEKLYTYIQENKDIIDQNIISDRDNDFDYFAIRTLERSYLIKTIIDGVKYILERPQFLFMRVALSIHMGNLEEAFETYKYNSKKYFTPATPTLFNSGTNLQQLSSCFLVSIEDNLEDIYDKIKAMAMISKGSGGLGVAISSLRAKNSLIRGTNGICDGIGPICQVLEIVAGHVNQGGKRKGSIGVYLEPWHADILEFCELKNNKGNEKNKARDLFLGLWVPDLFMKRVKEDKDWSLFCPDMAKGLDLVYGEEFEKLYEKYESEKKYVKQIRAIDLYYHIMDNQIETGMPYFCYKDSANSKSNQKNLGTIRSSNLCAEIIEYSDKTEIAVCNLASLCLPKFIKNNKFNFEKLYKITKLVTRFLNKVIDINYYPTKETKKSNCKHRPIGIGIQGLCDVYNIMHMPFESDEARILNRQIFETMYFASLEQSWELATIDGYYESFPGSPLSQGILQWHMWNKTEKDLLMNFDWNTLINNIKQDGTRNSLLMCCMPTASTSQLMGNYESFEVYLSNIFIKTTLTGVFGMINKNLIKILLENGIWTDKIRKKIIINQGSIQKIKEIPQKIKEIYKSAFEIQQKYIIIQAAERGIFIDQSQSMNLFMAKSNYNILNSCLFLGWSLGLKTGLYYLRSKPAVDPIKFGIDAEEIIQLKKELEEVDDKSFLSSLVLSKNMSQKERKKIVVGECLSCT
jgi:ribonucleoside-diphosphate reductase alpha subunit